MVGGWWLRAPPPPPPRYRSAHWLQSPAPAGAFSSRCPRPASLLFDRRCSPVRCPSSCRIPGPGKSPPSSDFRSDQLVSEVIEDGRAGQRPDLHRLLLHRGPVPEEGEDCKQVVDLNKSKMCPEQKSQIGWFAKRFVLCSSLSYSCEGFT